SDSAGFSGARIQFFPAAQARPQGPGQTERRGPRVRPRAEKGESRDRPGALGGFDSGALWHRDSSDDCAAGTEKKTALAAERAGEKHSSCATIPCRGFMKMCVARHSRTRSQLPGPWSAFADMEWPACSPAGNRIFPGDLHREKLLQVYEFLTREVMEDASRHLRPRFQREAGEGTYDWFAVRSLAELRGSEWDGDRRGVHG